MDEWSQAVLTPIVEELWKLLPLGVFLLFSRRASSLSLGDYALIGGAAGVGFQLAEETARRWLNSGMIGDRFGYSFSIFEGETIHWDLFALFPGRFEESLFPTLMSVSHPVHTALVALGIGIAYRLRHRLTRMSFIIPIIFLFWAILDHMSFNGRMSQSKFFDMIEVVHDWTGNGYKTRNTFLLLLGGSLIADYWSLNRLRKSLPMLQGERWINPFSELWCTIRASAVERGKFIQLLDFYRERRELGFISLYGKAEVTVRLEKIREKVWLSAQNLAMAAAILVAVGLVTSMVFPSYSVSGASDACFACQFDSLQDWWDRRGDNVKVALLIGAFSLALLFTGFLPALGFALTAASVAGSGKEIASYIRNPKKLLTPENAIAVVAAIALRFLPVGALLRGGAKRGSDLWKRIKKSGTPNKNIPPKYSSPYSRAQHAKYKELLHAQQAANPVIDSLRQTGKLPAHYVDKATAGNSGWKPGKALNNKVPGGQIGGDVFQNTTKVLPDAPGRVWHEADIGLSNTMSRAKQPGTRLLYSNDGLLYISVDHYKTVHAIGTYK